MIAMLTLVTFGFAAWLMTFNAVYLFYNVTGLIMAFADIYHQGED